MVTHKNDKDSSNQFPSNKHQRRTEKERRNRLKKGKTLVN
jgi:hypothetical protein